MSNPLCHTATKKHMTEIQTPTHYPEPPAELIEDIRKRLAEVPRHVAEHVDDALKRESIQDVANFLWKAGYCFTSADLYEYRKTLFPPNAMLDPYTSGPPVIHLGFADAPSVAAPSSPCLRGESSPFFPLRLSVVNPHHGAAQSKITVFPCGELPAG